MSTHGSTRRAVLVLLAAILGIAAGLGAIFGTAAVTGRPTVFLPSGLAAFCATYFLGLLLATHGKEPSRKRRVRAVSFCCGTAVLVGLFALTALLPMGDPRVPPAPVEDQRFWGLPTGSRIAHVRVAAEGDARKTPVIFLHGGPGTPDMRGDSEYFGRLAKDGFDVHVYDQVGTGRSSRLDDPQGYTLGRDVSDLEAIREEIGTERVVLIGHSYGGTLAAAYAASYPERVARMVLSFPGDPSPSAGGASMTFRLSTREKLGVYALLLPPRPMLAYSLLQVNPGAAHAFAGDGELDARQDRVYNRTRPALHCRDKPPGPKLHGLGFYANQYPQSARREPHEDFLPELEGREIPTLVIKGRCDYLSWSSAQEYLEVLPDGPAPLPGRLRAQRLPGRAPALHGRGAGVPARPTPPRTAIPGASHARRLRGAAVSTASSGMPMLCLRYRTRVAPTIAVRQRKEVPRLARDKDAVRRQRRNLGHLRGAGDRGGRDDTRRPNCCSLGFDQRGLDR